MRYTYLVDVFAVGCVLVEACHGLYIDHFSEQFQKVAASALPPVFPEPLGRIKTRCVSINPRERYGRGSDDGTLLSVMLAMLVNEIGGSERWVNNEREPASPMALPEVIYASARTTRRIKTKAHVTMPVVTPRASEPTLDQPTASLL